VLLAIGRYALTDECNVKAAGVEVTKSKKIQVPGAAGCAIGGAVRRRKRLLKCWQPSEAAAAASAWEHGGWGKTAARAACGVRRGVDDGALRRAAAACASLTLVQRDWGGRPSVGGALDV